jgi:hypothetical protein
MDRGTSLVHTAKNGRPRAARRWSELRGPLCAYALPATTARYAHSITTRFDGHRKRLLDESRLRSKARRDRLSYGTYQKTNCIIEYCCITLNVERRCCAPGIASWKQLSFHSRTFEPMSALPPKADISSVWQLKEPAQRLLCATRMSLLLTRTRPPISNQRWQICKQGHDGRRHH